MPASTPYCRAIALALSVCLLLAAAASGTTTQPTSVDPLPMDAFDPAIQALPPETAARWQSRLAAIVGTPVAAPIVDEFDFEPNVQTAWDIEARGGNELRVTAVDQLTDRRWRIDAGFNTQGLLIRRSTIEPLATLASPLVVRYRVRQMEGEPCDLSLAIGRTVDGLFWGNGLLVQFGGHRNKVNGVLVADKAAQQQWSAPMRIRPLTWHDVCIVVGPQSVIAIVDGRPLTVAAIAPAEREALLGDELAFYTYWNVVHIDRFSVQRTTLVEPPTLAPNEVLQAVLLLDHPSPSVREATQAMLMLTAATERSLLMANPATPTAMLDFLERAADVPPPLLPEGRRRLADIADLATPPTPPALDSPTTAPAASPAPAR